VFGRLNRAAGNTASASRPYRCLLQWEGSPAAFPMTHSSSDPNSKNKINRLSEGSNFKDKTESAFPPSYPRVWTPQHQMFNCADHPAVNFNMLAPARDEARPESPHSPLRESSLLSPHGEGLVQSDSSGCDLNAVYENTAFQSTTRGRGPTALPQMCAVQKSHASRQAGSPREVSDNVVRRFV
jgi:hypothetical protein